jgi:hypothetical protein
MPTHRLSKSRFMAGLQCERRLWMLANRPEDRREPTLAERHRMDTGIAFGRSVTQLFPDGAEITADYQHPQEALDSTQAILRRDTPALFEAAFLHHDVLVRADILQRSEASPEAWGLIEVKSASNSAGSESARRPKLKKHISDMAIQLYVLEGAGLSVESISLAWVNSRYERTGALDWQQLVAIEDHSDAVRTRAQGIPNELDRFLSMLDQTALPDAVYGKTKCAACEFNQVCWGDEPDDSIIYLPRLSAAKFDELRVLGVQHIHEIPTDYPLTPGQRSMVEALDHPDGFVADRPKLAQWVADLEYPLYYFDFETWNPCIPPFDRTRPYLQIPFQYSVHVQQQPGAEPTHHEFLADGSGDPRPDLIEQMRVDLGEVGSIVVHYAAFERGRIEELARFSPEQQEPLTRLLDRVVDTEVPFKRNWYLHPELMGRSSIKVVLPTLAPEFSYAELAIAEGQAASLAFGDLYEGRIAANAVEATRQALLDYCRMDTLAMLKIVERLRGLVDDGPHASN